MSNPLYTYDFKEVSVILNGNILTGFIEGDAIEVAPDEDDWSLQVGADGESTRSKRNNNSATVTIRLMQTAASNDVLNALYQADKLSSTGKAAMLIKDNSGRSIHAAEEAWIQKAPTASYGNEAGSREWVLRTHNLVSTFGGN